MRWLLLPLAVCLLLLIPIDRKLRGMELVALNATSGNVALVTRHSPAPQLKIDTLRVAGTDLPVSVWGSGRWLAGPRLVLANGVVRDGRNYGPLVVLARSLARVGFEVAVPELFAYRELRLHAQDVGVMEAAIGGADPADAVVGISVGGSLGMIAASRRADPPPVVAIGPYGELQQLLAAVLTGQFEHRGQPVPYRPAGFVGQVVRDTVLAQISPADAVRLKPVFNDPGSAGPELTGHLSSSGRAVLELFRVTDHRHVPTVVAGLPPRLRMLLSELSPTFWVGGGTGRAVVFHFSGDPYFPHQGSQLLIEQFGPRGQLFDSGLIDHGELVLPAISPQSLADHYLPETVRFLGFVDAALEATGF
ncbi:MAG: hypothetical protein OXG77_01325 [Chloroflexi bacterium]|nr:hypothetical protein [Chloroflexota bacterium]